MTTSKKLREASGIVKRCLLIQLLLNVRRILALQHISVAYDVLATGGYKMVRVSGEILQRPHTLLVF